jgi:DNA-binding beta-propeller fold protein YncE
MDIKALLILIAAALVLSCSRTIYPVTSPDNLVIYPAPPDTARIQFLTRISSSHDVTGGRKTFAKSMLGEDKNISINKPYGVAVHAGKILICDTFIHGIVIIDMIKNKFEQFIPKGKGELKVPVNCYVDSIGNLYIADSERKQIVIFDAKGKYLNSFGESDNFKPTDVFVRNNKIWVSNISGHQIHVYSNDSRPALLNSFPKANTVTDRNLYSPTNLYVTDNKVYVTDFGDFKIKIFTHDGEFIRSIGSYGNGIGQFVRPKGIAVDRDSNLFVVDAGFENTQVFSKEGKLLMFFGGNYKGPGDMWLPAKVTLDYDNLEYFQKFVDPSFKLKYVIFVTNQFGPDKLSIYGAVEPLKAGQRQEKKQILKKRNRDKPLFLK